MRTMVQRFYENPYIKNDLYAQGYRYYCDGDFKLSSHFDPWSGMPNVDRNTYFFDNKDEAEAFAAKQVWPFNHDCIFPVKELPPHSITPEEWAEED